MCSVFCECEATVFNEDCASVWRMGRWRLCGLLLLRRPVVLRVGHEVAILHFHSLDESQGDHMLSDAAESDSFSELIKCHTQFFAVSKLMNPDRPPATSQMNCTPYTYLCL